MADLSNLSPSEYEKISSVLKRDQQLRSMEEARIRQLKEELRLQAALKPGFDPLRNCARCVTELGRVLNRGALCPICLKKVCKDCRHYGYINRNHEWLCIYCYKQMQLKAVSGEWMLEFSRLSEQNNTIESPRSQLNKLLCDTQNKGVRSNDDRDAFYSQIIVDPVPEKPPRIFIYEPNSQNSSSEPPVQDRPSEMDSKPSEQRKDNRPSLLPRIRSWSELKPEATKTIRIDKSLPLKEVQQSNFKKRQSFDSRHSSASYRSVSVSNGIANESEPHFPVPLPRKRINSLTKGLKPKSQIFLANQQSSTDATQSDVCVPVLKTKLSFHDRSASAFPVVLTKPSTNELEPTERSACTPYLAGESSLSETDDDRKSQTTMLENIDKKRKVAHSRSEDDKSSNPSTDESGNSLRSSPHNRYNPRNRNRSSSGGSDDGKQKKCVPQKHEGLETSRLSTGSSEKDSSGVQDEDIDQHFSFITRSQMSLSSFGGRSESVTSVYSAAGGRRYGTVIVTGDVLFGLNYNFKAGVLEVNIKECRNLAAVDIKKNRSDPYVKVYLLPDRTKSGKRKTKVKKHTLNPVFDELLKFQVTVSELEIRTLWLSVWHSDRFGRNDFLGEIMLPLNKDIFENSGLKWYPLQERLETMDSPVVYKGDLILALKYVPPDVTSRNFSKKPGSLAKGALEVLVREARNLTATRSNGTSDPFCKSYLLPDKSKAGKQKTPVIKKTCNPKWNHTFVYDDVSLDDLRERCLELTIWDYDKITSNDFLGGVRLSLGTGKYQGRDVDWMDSVGEERSLWYTMLDRPNTWVDSSLLLRSNMQSRRTV